MMYLYTNFTQELNYEVGLGQWHGDMVRYIDIDSWALKLMPNLKVISPNEDKIGVMRIRVDDIEKMKSNWLDEFHQWAIQKLQQRRAILVLMAGHESYDWRNVADKMHHDLATYQIPQNNVVIWQGSANMNDLYTSVYKEGGLHIIDEWSDCARLLAETVPLSPNVNIAHQPRTEHFLCMMRESKYHRLELLEWVLRNDLMKFFHFSCGPVHPSMSREFLLSTQAAPLTLDIQDWDDDDYFIAMHGQKYYQDSYINITCESSTMEPIFFSEKIWKPILNHQPFIVIAQPGFLAQLRKLGFETWAPWIDEHYDEISDSHHRQIVIHREIHRLSQLPLEKLVTMRHEMHSHLEHNRNHFFNIDYTVAFQKLSDIVNHAQYLLHNHQ